MNAYAGEADPCAWDPEESNFKWFTEQDGDKPFFMLISRAKIQIRKRLR